MDQTKITELEAAAVAAKTAAEAAGGTDEALNKAHQDAEAALATAKTSPDPVDAALKEEQARNKRTETEKAEYTLRKQAARARELGLDPAQILGVTSAPTNFDDGDDDNKPVTRGDLRRIQQEAATKTAFEMADGIEDEKERELTKEYLKRVVPSGNPAEDLKFARLAVNATKTGQVLEEIGRHRSAPSHSSGTGGPGRQEDNSVFTPDKNEAALMRPPFNLSKEDIIKAREKSQR